MRRSLAELLRMPLLAHDGYAWFHSEKSAVTRRICAYRTDARPMPREARLKLFYGPKSRPGAR